MCDPFLMEVVKTLDDLFKEFSTDWFFDNSVSALSLDVLM